MSKTSDIMPLRPNNSIMHCNDKCLLFSFLTSQMSLEIFFGLPQKVYAEAAIIRIYTLTHRPAYPIIV